MQTHRDILFADGEYRFLLTVDAILKLQHELGIRIGAIHAHVLRGRYINDMGEFGYDLEADYGVHELLKICEYALIYGNRAVVEGREVPMTGDLAKRLVKLYLSPDHGNPLSKAWDLATAVLNACVHGYDPDGDDQKKSPPKPTKPRAASKGGK
ncbi:hypothetical protein CP98_03656 [Sphingobium yanoikuyae]|uniref:Gene transfer agent family protein n=1 Tax=Sphingobium yanoikuyae TaxID=13690 RepID=A0A084EGR6_SPHYA|nr:hypothetical protein [Sphingobium yanoikuyae]KEZ17158.1 hypothetical protein CP98_03656 [Sphingobium yanoikuyae]